MKSKFNDWGRVDRGVLLILKIVLELGMGERLGKNATKIYKHSAA